ncbi:cell wall hydrolase [Clostridium vincentii]|uniref:Spore cortex-lytic enzyme n=1 Tax=Clostridium vincentii TaxID=52704 RepID=A0A2T0BI70_9CLOT|nr:cell wall hydrolase [Clostridium vincentii]PRR83590.1 Spore cortex-lytic enzyme precursor [Clostridium vincentii]
MKISKKLCLLCLALSLVFLCSNPATAKALSISINNEIESTTENTENNIDTAVEVFNSGTQTLYLTRSDIDLMAKLIYAESRGEPFEGKVAVASVVLNRVVDPKFPSTVTDVIFQSKAFSCVQNGDIKAFPDEICYSAVYEAIRGTDPTNEAVFFYNPTISTCSWMKSTEKKDSKSIGHHLFFKC